MKQISPVLSSIMLLLFTLFSLHCGLFLPGDAETPDPNQTPIEDPLSLRRAIDNTTGEYFPFQDYQLLFSSSAIYYDGNKPDERFEKARILNRVNIIEKNYLKITDEFKLNITWSHAEDDPALERDKIITLKPRVCTTFVIDHVDTTVINDTLTTYDTTFVLYYTSEATFDLQFNTSRGEWNILKWVETKITGKGDKPFYHPNFILPTQ